MAGVDRSTHHVRADGRPAGRCRVHRRLPYPVAPTSTACLRATPCRSLSRRNDACVFGGEVRQCGSRADSRVRVSAALVAKIATRGNARN
jgi:hypothetical protein